MNDKLIFSIFLITFLLVTLGFFSGLEYGKTLSRKEAIENNAAYWHADPATGTLEFKWKTQE